MLLEPLQFNSSISSLEKSYSPRRQRTLTRPRTWWMRYRDSTDQDALIHLSMVHSWITRANCWCNWHYNWLTEAHEWDFHCAIPYPTKSAELCVRKHLYQDALKTCTEVSYQLNHCMVRFSFSMRVRLCFTMHMSFFFDDAWCIQRLGV